MLSFALLTVYASLALASPISLLERDSSCACGYRDAAGYLWREAIEADFKNNYEGAMENFIPMDWGTDVAGYWRQNKEDNIYSSDEGLQMKVSAYDNSGTIYTSEMESGKSDILYGTFRIKAAIPTTPGVCFAFFTYSGEDQETDIEWLSSHPERAYYTNQPYQTKDAQKLVTTKSTDYTELNEHRFDWHPSGSKFFVNDELKTNITVNTQTAATAITINNWSTGDPYWSEGPPTGDAVATIEFIKAYFNSTSLSESAFQTQCSKAKVAECKI